MESFEENQTDTFTNLQEDIFEKSG